MSDLPPTKPPFCKNCHHATIKQSYDSDKPDVALCLHPTNIIGYDLVFGSPKLRHSDCWVNRQNHLETRECCGNEGRWFIAKESVAAVRQALPASPTERLLESKIATMLKKRLSQVSPGDGL